jgi:hypothetical protein
MESNNFQAWLDMLTINSEHTAKTYKNIQKSNPTILQRTRNNTTA